MLYLLDANVLIDANRDYYPMGRVPEFWEWLVREGEAGRVKIPVEIFEEVKEGTDDLAVWIKEERVKEALILNVEADTELVSRAVENGYAADLTDDEILQIGRDPFLLGYALSDPANHCIVTTEVSKPTKQRARKHLPNSAASLGLNTCNTFQMIQRLDFRTNWRS